jgi:hypothetical protein
MLEHVPHLVWAGAVGTIAYCGHRVAIIWLNQRGAAQASAEARDEREMGAVARCVSDVEAMRAEIKALHIEQKAFVANNRR